mmetsp:Transcript_4619/g.14125  ORF Transcript_4619/g.14125 Transcript_4619/m.14125 type:complete len:218 (-) Transcript_4619:1681-2334(-)
MPRTSATGERPGRSGGMRQLARNAAGLPHQRGLCRLCAALLEPGGRGCIALRATHSPTGHAAGGAGGAPCRRAEHARHSAAVVPPSYAARATPLSLALPHTPREDRPHGNPSGHRSAACHGHQLGVAHRRHLVDELSVLSVLCVLCVLLLNHSSCRCHCHCESASFPVCFPGVFFVVRLFRCCALTAAASEPRQRQEQLEQRGSIPARGSFGRTGLC